MTRHERAYRWLMSIYPASFRERYEEEMVTLFTDQLRDARASGNRRGTAVLWVRCLGDLISTAPGQHLLKEELVPRPIDPDSVALLAEPEPRSLSKLGYSLALLPLWAGILLGLAVPSFMEPLFLNPPSIFGLPMGIVLTFAAGLLMAFGVLAMRWARSASGRAAAFLLLTVPSLIVIVFAPASILIVLNLNV